MSKEFGIEKLAGSSNYHSWSFEMKNLLKVKKLFKYISQEAVNDEKSSECAAIISLCVEKSMFVYIRNLDSPKQIWETLQSRFEEKGLTRKIGLLRNLISTRLNGGGMETYLNSITDLANKLSGIGFKIDDEWLAAIMLAGLDDSYKPFIMGLEAAGGDITPDNIASKLIDTAVEENSASQTALLAKKGFKRKPKCFNCGQKGHFKSECKSEPKMKPSKQAGSAKAAFVAFHTTVTSDNSWYIDSGASNHMTPNGKILSGKKNPTWTAS
jgi:gag-polypeptide of LTR copia-type/Zinc knuckle